MRKQKTDDGFGKVEVGSISSLHKLYDKPPDPFMSADLICYSAIVPRC